MGDYTGFLDRRSQLGGQYGFAPSVLPQGLFPFQSYLVDWSLRKGRSAIFADCGMGKTLQALAWAEQVVRHTNKRVLILTPLAVGYQFVAEGERFGIACSRSRDGSLEGEKILIANYEQLHRFDPSDFVGIVADESSRLKHFSGATQKYVTRFMTKIPYRLLCTATAAPNDYIELGTSSEALGELGYTDMLSRFFVQNDNIPHRLQQVEARKIKRGMETLNGENSTKLAFRIAQTIQPWRLKGHAVDPFWRWVSTWARACRKPSDLGFDDNGFILPALSEQEHLVKEKILFIKDGTFFPDIPFGLHAEQEERRRTIEERCEKVKELSSHKDPVVIWVQYNNEGDLLERMLPDAVQVKGSQSDEEKEERLIAFLKGQSRILITKSKIAGFGLNFQHCAHVITFATHCYDEQTEILTKRGWLTFGHVLFTDEVATVNQDSLAFEWQHPTDIIWSSYEGPMIRFCGDGKSQRSFDLLVTPNHRMFVQRSLNRYPNATGEYEFKEAGWLAEHFKRQEYCMLSCPKTFYGAKTESIEIPTYIHPHGKIRHGLNNSGDRRGMNSAGTDRSVDLSLIRISHMSVDQFMRLAGWYLSEGSCGMRNGVLDGQITICQGFGNVEYRAEIIALLRSIPGLHVYEKTKDIRCCSKQLAVFLTDQFGIGSLHKHIPMWVKELSRDYLEILRDTMLKGDGCHAKGIPKFYRTVSHQLADDFQEICLKTGLRASVHQHNYKNHLGENPLYDVNIAWKNLNPSIHVLPKKIAYNGMIGCVSVPNGTVIVRRNGIPVVSGNSWESYYQAVRRCWRFGQQRPVAVDIVLTQGERRIRDNMVRKSEAADVMFGKIIKHMRDFVEIDHVVDTEKERVPEWLSMRR